MCDLFRFSLANPIQATTRQSHLVASAHWPELFIEHEVNVGLDYPQFKCMVSRGDFQPSKYHMNQVVLQLKTASTKSCISPNNIYKTHLT